MKPPPYSKFRSGVSYEDAYKMLWRDDPDPATWRRKNRGAVLKLMKQIKRDLYAEAVAQWEAELAARAKEDWARGFGALRRRRRKLPPAPF